MIRKGESSERATAMMVADLMATAAKTAPSGRGIDDITALILDGEDKDRLTEKMREMAEGGEDLSFFRRDAAGVDASHCIVLIGARHKPGGLPHCGWCGFDNCAEAAKAGIRCAFNTVDLGIALGSAVSIAADNRIDNRILYSAGKAAVEAGFFDADVSIACGIPLSTYAKSNFHDRMEQGLMG